MSELGLKPNTELLCHSSLSRTVNDAECLDTLTLVNLWHWFIHNKTVLLT